MQEENFNTGRLSRFNERKYGDGSYDATSSDLSRTEKTGGIEATTVLKEQVTTVLEDEGTTVLHNYQDDSFKQNALAKSVIKGRFNLVKDIVLINTDEEL